MGRPARRAAIITAGAALAARCTIGVAAAVVVVDDQGGSMPMAPLIQSDSATGRWHQGEP